MNTLDCYFLPKNVELTEFRILKFESRNSSFHARIPVLTGEKISEVIDSLLDCRERYLEKAPLSDIVDSISAAVSLWENPNYEYRKVAEEFLPTISGFSRKMIEESLDLIAKAFKKEELMTLIKSQFGDPLLIDEFRWMKDANCYRRAFGPSLITHIFSGNVAGLPAQSLICALLIKSASLGKTASEEPLFPILFARSLFDVNPDLSACLAISNWKGGDEEIENVAFSRSEAVFAYGSDRTINSVSKKLKSSVRFVPYGHKLSFGVIGKEVLNDAISARETARKAAIDASFFDQQGCVCPHVMFVEIGGKFSSIQFAEMLSQEMENFHRRIPRGELPISDSAAILRLRTTFEFKGMVNEEIQVFSSTKSSDWTVIHDPDNIFQPSCLNRTVRVCPINDISEIPTLVLPIQENLQSVGVALLPERVDELGLQLGRMGVSRVCQLGTMYRPPTAWCHDGRMPLLDLIRWLDLERKQSE